MKITKSQLKQIIKEELEAIQEETPEQLVGKLEIEAEKMGRFGPGAHKTLLNVKKLLDETRIMAQEKGWPSSPVTQNSINNIITSIDELNALDENGLLTQLETLPRGDARNRLRGKLRKFWFEPQTITYEGRTFEDVERNRVIQLWIKAAIKWINRSIPSSQLKQTFEL